MDLIPSYHFVIQYQSYLNNQAIRKDVR